MEKRGGGQLQGEHNLKLPENCIGAYHESSGSNNADDPSELSAPPEQRRVIEWIYDAVDGVTLAEKAVLRKVLWLDKTEGLGCNGLELERDQNRLREPQLSDPQDG